MLHKSNKDEMAAQALTMCYRFSRVHERIQFHRRTQSSSVPWLKPGAHCSPLPLLLTTEAIWHTVGSQLH